jgi:hypothetical protein
MSIILHSHLLNHGRSCNQLAGISLLLFVSAVVFAQSNGYTELPESYRTPLSDMIYEGHTDWRAAPEEDNPWRESEEEQTIKPRIKTEFFPEPDYSTKEDPSSSNLFQNEYEVEKPRTNIFRYSF